MTVTRRVQKLAYRCGLDIHRVRTMTDSAVRLAKIFEHNGVDLLLDVGAYTGAWAAGIRAAGYSGTIVSIEPQEREYRRVLALSSDDARWTVEHAAAGASEGVAELRVAREGDWSSLHEVISDHPVEGSTRRTEQVQVRRIDSLRLPPSERTFIKVDVQGHELDVLKGCEGIRDQMIGVQAEVSLDAIYANQPLIEDILAAAKTMEMRLMGVENGWINPATGHEGYIDLLFLRQ